MHPFFIFASIWYGIGLLTCVVGFFIDGKFKVGEIPLLLGLSLFGPLLTIIFISGLIKDHADVVIWERKAKPSQKPTPKESKVSTERTMPYDDPR